MSDSTSKNIADHEKKQEHEGFTGKESELEKERASANRKERAAEDVTEAPRQ